MKKLLDDNDLHSQELRRAARPSCQISPCAKNLGSPTLTKARRPRRPLPGSDASDAVEAAQSASNTASGGLLGNPNMTRWPDRCAGPRPGRSGHAKNNWLPPRQRLLTTRTFPMA